MTLQTCRFLMQYSYKVLSFSPLKHVKKLHFTSEADGTVISSTGTVHLAIAKIVENTNI